MTVSADGYSGLLAGNGAAGDDVPIELEELQVCRREDGTVRLLRRHRRRRKWPLEI